MAYLFSATSSLWTSSNWKVIDQNGLMLSEATNAAPGTTFQSTAAFIPGAITVEGILLKVKYKTTVATPTTTLSVRLFNATASSVVVGTTVSCYASDLFNNDSAAEGGWVYFKFASPVTLLAATNYTVQAAASVAGSIYVYVSAGTNWARALVTSTTAAPASTDILYICGDVTGTGSYATNTITFDNTSATSYGGLELGAYGKLVGQNSASTNYNLTLSSGAVFRIGQNGIVELSTTGSRLPSTSTFTLTMTCATNGATFMDVRNYGTFRAYGASKLRKTVLTSNLASGSTTLTTADSTSWLSGDNIGVAGTSGSANAYNRQQQLTLASNASGTTLTTTTGSAFLTEGTSSGTYSIQSDVINLTSNMVIQGTSTTLCGYTLAQRLSIYDVDNVEYKYMGAASSTNAAVYIFTNQNQGTSTLSSFGATGSCSIRNSSFWNSSTGWYIYNGNNILPSYTIDGVVTYNALNANTSITLTNTDTFNSSSLKNCVVIGSSTGINIAYNDVLTIDNNVSANCTTYGIQLVGSQKSYNGFTVSNTKLYRNQYGFINVMAATTYTTALMTLSNLTTFRNTYGIYATNIVNSTIKDSTIFGNYTANLYIGNIVNSKIVNCNIQSGTGVACPYGVYYSSLTSGRLGLIFERCNIGTVTTHASGDILADAFPNQSIFNNCNFGSTTTLAGTLSGLSKIAMQRFNSTAGSHRTYTAGGYMINDTTIYDVSPNSLRLVPNTTTSSLILNWSNPKLQSTYFQIPVNSGSTATISAKIRKSVTADGTAYNGTQPRLVLRSNPSAGSFYNDDIICASGSSAISGSWETLTYTLPSASSDNVAFEFYVDCDGTTGWVNVDSISAASTNNLTNYINGEPTVIGASAASSTGYSYTFVS